MLSEEDKRAIRQDIAAVPGMEFGEALGYLADFSIRMGPRLRAYSDFGLAQAAMRRYADDLLERVNAGIPITP